MVWNRWMLCYEFPYKMDDPTETFPDYGKWNIRLVTEEIKHMQKMGSGQWKGELVACAKKQFVEEILFRKCLKEIFWFTQDG